MVDREGESLADDEDLKIENEDAGALFRVEMAAVDFLGKYYLHLIAIAVATVVGVGLYGQYSQMYQAGQRNTTAAIADVVTDLPKDMMSLAATKAGFGPKGEDIDVEQLSESAGQLMELGAKGSNTASVEAYLKAAELYRLADDSASRRKALEAAAAGTTGVLRYAAVAGLANLDLEEDQVEQGLARFRELSLDKGYLGQQASLDLAAALEVLDRAGEAVPVYDDYVRRWPKATNIDDVRQRREKAAGQGA